MKRTMLMTIMAMSLALGASRADMPAGTNKLEEHPGLAKWFPVAGEGAIATKAPGEQQRPVGLILPGKANRKKAPQLMAIGPCGHCITNSPFSTWQQFQLALSMLDLLGQTASHSLRPSTSLFCAGTQETCRHLHRDSCTFSLSKVFAEDNRHTRGSLPPPSPRTSSSAFCLCIRCVGTHKRSPGSFPLPDTRRCSTRPTLSRMNRAGVHTFLLSRKPFLPSQLRIKIGWSKSKC